MKKPSIHSRRRFLATTAGTGLAAPSLLLAQKSIAKHLVIGAGEHKFEVHHDWAKLPAKYSANTHNVALDKAGNLYVIHEGRPTSKNILHLCLRPERPIHPAFGNQFQGGGHGIEVREEGGEEFLTSAVTRIKAFAKLTLKGETVWEKYAPMDSGVYRKDEDKGA